VTGFQKASPDICKNLNISNDSLSPSFCGVTASGERYLQNNFHAHAYSHSLYQLNFKPDLFFIWPYLFGMLPLILGLQLVIWNELPGLHSLTESFLTLTTSIIKKFPNILLIHNDIF
jgi:hypothetical protein